MGEDISRGLVSKAVTGEGKAWDAWDESMDAGRRKLGLGVVGRGGFPGGGG